MKNLLSKGSLLCFTLCVFVCGSASAGIINGDFSSGDFTGWTVSAYDDALNPIADPSPFISISGVGGSNAARFKTGQFTDGLFMATLEQTYTIPAARPFLTFEFTLPVIEVDPTGSGTSPFLDSWAVSLQSGTDFFDLLLVDQTGPYADPFGTAPGTVTLGAANSAGFDYLLRADLTSLAGSEVTLFFDMFQEDDEAIYEMFSGNSQQAEALKQKPVIPEPSSLAIASGFVLIAAAWNLKRRRQTRALIVSL
jgi:hypothetical protein